jgi:hypothetical protein
MDGVANPVQQFHESFRIAISRMNRQEQIKTVLVPEIKAGQPKHVACPLPKNKKICLAFACHFSLCKKSLFALRD